MSLSRKGARCIEFGRSVCARSEAVRDTYECCRGQLLLQLVTKEIGCGFPRQGLLGYFVVLRHSCSSERAKASGMPRDAKPRSSR